MVEVALAAKAMGVPKVIARCNDPSFIEAMHLEGVDNVICPAQTASRLNAMAMHLAETLRRDPHHPRANVRMAAIYLRQFDAQQQTSENPMPLNQIRDAALASQPRLRPQSARELHEALRRL